MVHTRRLCCDPPGGAYLAALAWSPWGCMHKWPRGAPCFCFVLFLVVSRRLVLPFQTVRSICYRYVMCRYEVWKYVVCWIPYMFHWIPTPFGQGHSTKFSALLFPLNPSTNHEQSVYLSKTLAKGMVEWPGQILKFSSTPISCKDLIA